MKTTLLVLFLCLWHVLNATTYYFSSSSGDDLRTSAEAQNAATPWKTLNKLNSFLPSLKPGDVVLLKRGDTWYGQINIKSASSITFGAYGSGAKPIISGATTVTTWTSLGGNIYESTSAVSTLSAVNVLTIDGIVYAMGRYPNANAANGGYLTIDSHTEDSVIFDAANLSSTINWTGARAVVKVNAFFLDTSIVEAHSGNRIDLASSKITYNLINGFGYFIQNDRRTLDQHGEWYFDIVTKKVRIYLTTPPANYSIKISTVDNVISFSGANYITLDNLNIQYANGHCTRLSTSNNIRIQNCALQFAGNDGINSRSGNSNLFATDNYISDCANHGMNLRDMGVHQIIGNTIRKIGLFPGMGGFANGTASQHRHAISSTASNVLIEGNVIDSLGYLGIRFAGNNTIVRYNHVSSFCMTLQDGGGIYTFNGHNPAGDLLTGRQVIYNTVHDGIGSPQGTNSTSNASYGIYLDDNSSGVEIGYNTVFNCPRDGLYIHNSHKLNVHHNTFFNNAGYQALFGKDQIHPQEIHQVNFKHNILVSKTPTQGILFLYNTLTATTGHINTFGSIDTNYYARPFDDSLTIKGRNLGLATQSYTLATWQAAYVHDSHSKKSPKTFSVKLKADECIQFFYNPSKVPETIALNGTYVDARNQSYTSNATLQPYSSIVLFKISDPVNTAPKVSIINPSKDTNYISPADITITASASDADGKVSKVEFYDGTTLLGSDTTSPYTYTWNSAPVGTHNVTARAIDDDTAYATSAVVVITVSIPNAAPLVSITNPTNDTTFTSPEFITISASASDADGQISKVEFYSGTTLLGSDNTSPYSFTWNNIPPGTYTITAKATDNGLLSTTSAAVKFVVLKALNAPEVSITSPLQNDSFNTPASVTILTSASDSDGTISRIDFYSGGTLLGSDNSAPFSFTWNNVPAGTYILTAKATDDAALSTTSDAVTISVIDPNVAPVVSITSPLNNESIYAPKTVLIQANATDAGGTIQKVEFYNGSILMGSDNTSPYSFSWTNITSGTYKLTAKAFDDGGLTSTSAEVTVTVYATNGAPVVTITSPAANTVFTAPASVTLDATAEDEDGSISKVDFYSGTQFIGSDNSQPYSFTWNNVPKGTHILTARATDNVGNTTTSEEVTIKLDSATVPTFKMQIAPNPVANILSIFSDQWKTIVNVKINVVSMAGIVLKTFDLYASDQVVTLDVSWLKSGTYVLQLSFGDTFFAQKFIKL